MQHTVFMTNLQLKRLRLLASQTRLSPPLARPTALPV